MEAEAPGRRTYLLVDGENLLVDGENIDATVGTTLLNRRPTAEERPRWDRVERYAEELWEQPVTGLFFLNASAGHMPTAFVQALVAIGYRPVPLAGRPDQKVVDIGVQLTLDALVGHDADVLLVSHDGDFAPHMRALMDGERRVGLLALREFASTQYAAMDMPVHDLEDDVGAFNVPLPRVKIIALDDFDPERFLR